MRTLTHCFLALVFAAAALAEEEAPAAAETPAAASPEETAEIDESESYVPTSPRWPLLARIGVRAGYLALGPGEGLQYGDGPILGLCLGLTRSRRSRVSCEFTLDAALLQEVEAIDEDSLVLLERVNFLFSLGRRDWAAQPYLLCGAGGMQEFLVKTSGAVADNYAWPVDVGAGVTLGGGRFDVRVAYSSLIDSENVKGLLTVGLAVYF